MKLRNKAAMLLAFSMMVSLGSVATVNAAEMENEFSTLKESSSFEEVAEVGSLKQFKGDSIDKIKMDDSGIALTATGDSYEANNGPAVATKGRYNKITYASLHDANDVDWYTIEVLDTSKPISVFLTNIPSGCDYDMYLLKYDSTLGITKMYYNLQSGTTAEELYGTVDEVGTYYVVVQASTSSSIENNFSSSNYTLYMGDYYRVGQYGYVDTGLDISFGNIPVGNTTPVYRGWYTYDLSNEASIPNDAIVTKIYLTGNGNGAYWLGFYKMMAAAGQGIQLESKIGQIEVMYSGDNQLLAKQKWLIGGKIMASTNFVWEPQILIAYKYAATISNMRFFA